MTVPKRSGQSSTSNLLSYRWRVRGRLFLSIVVAAIASSFIPRWVSLTTRSLGIWDVGAIVFLLSTWVLMVQAKPETMRRYARYHDEGRLSILSLITAAACASLLAIALILREIKEKSIGLIVPHLVLAVTTIVVSWLLVHTIFALHYAREYYQDSRTNRGCPAKGLDFPTDSEPDYLDFLYFSFVIGMTSQVSDVQVTSRSLRRLSLLHGVLSFFFNTAILAMSINTIATLIQSL